MLLRIEVQCGISFLSGSEMVRKILFFILGGTVKRDVQEMNQEIPEKEEIEFFPGSFVRQRAGSEFASGGKEDGRLALFR